MPQLLVKPLAFFKINPQVRKTFDEADLRRLGESLKVKQLQPVLCQPDGTLIAGERRFRAAKLVGLASLEVKIADETLSDSQIRVWQLTENMQRADLTGHEKWLGCAELMCMNPGWQMKDCAEALHLDPSMVPRLLSPSKCIPAWQEALAAGKVGISDCYAASKLPEAEQAGLLALKLNGASRDSIEQAGRKRRNGTTPAVKVAKVKCLLPSGFTVIVSGEGVSLDDAAEALADAIKEMKRARDLGYTAKTFTAAMADKARTNQKGV
jgi:ParB family chromosome partitioning protein